MNDLCEQKPLREAIALPEIYVSRENGSFFLVIYMFILRVPSFILRVLSSSRAARGKKTTFFVRSELDSVAHSAVFVLLSMLKKRM